MNTKIKTRVDQLPMFPLLVLNGESEVFRVERDGKTYLRGASVFTDRELAEVLVEASGSGPLVS